MHPLAIIILSSWLAGLAAYGGGLLARLENLPESDTKRITLHGIIAFGGGILMSAIAFALIPEGIAYLHSVSLTLIFISGGVLFCIVDIALARTGGTKAQFMAMLLDFIPEAISLGAVFSHDHRLGMLLATFIGAQNLPEGFNAYREVVAAGMRPRRALGIIAAASLLGPIAACAGYFLLQDHPSLTAAIMTFASGGLLYLIFQDIAPQAMLQYHWVPNLGAVLGFAVGLLGKVLIG